MKNTGNKQSKTKISNGVKSHANDPFVIKKANASKAMLDKYGFPEEFIKDRRGAI